MTTKSQAAKELAELTQRTVAYYNQNADDFFVGTRDHDVRQNMDALLQFIEGAVPHSILDFGCGPGRDLKALSALETLLPANFSTPLINISIGAYLSTKSM